MLKFKTNIDEKEYKEFLFENNASFMQEINWAKTKSNWDNIVCGVYEKNHLVAACSILIRNLTKKIKLFYIPRGYVMDLTNEKVFNFMTINIKDLAKQMKAYAVKIDPNVCKKEYFFKNNESPFDFYSKNQKIIHNIFLKNGYKHNGFNLKLHDNLQPRFNMVIPLIDKEKKKLNEEELLQTFKSKFRYYLGKWHEDRGVFYTHSFDKKDIKEFVSILQATEKNKNIHLRNEAYFEKMMNNFPNRICLLFGKVDIDKYINFIKSKENNKDKINYLNDLKKEYGNIITLSSALLLLPNCKDFKSSEYLYAGNSLLLKELKVSGEIAVEAAKISIQNNCQYCNLGGVEGNFKDSLSVFKSKYNTIVLEFLGEYTLVINKPLNLFIEKFKPILTSLYKKIKK